MAGTLPVFSAPRRGGWRRPSVLWLAALLLALRALIPTGFMPDPGALRAGRFELVYCSAYGPMPAGMAMAAHHMSEPRSSMDRAGHGMPEPRSSMDHAGHGMPDGVSSPGPAPAAPDNPNMPADCPFGLTGAYTFLPPLPAVVAAMLGLAWQMPAPRRFSSCLPGIAAGPPVGCRAPPSRLA